MPIRNRDQRLDGTAEPDRIARPMAVRFDGNNQSEGAAAYPITIGISECLADAEEESAPAFTGPSIQLEAVIEAQQQNRSAQPEPEARGLSQF